MTSLTFYGGVHEIGGNKILIEDQSTKVFLDFGMSFSLVNQYFDEFMSASHSSIRFMISISLS
jgi:ribonuclease J